nr:MAG TPA: hypothetical protein [Caudoviricetes sp.]
MNKKYSMPRMQDAEVFLLSARPGTARKFLKLL